MKYYNIIVLAVSVCSAPVVPTNAHISNQSNSVYIEGTKVTFLCSDNLTSLTTICYSNGNWGPNPAELECEPSSSGKIILSHSKILTSYSGFT